MIFTWRDLVSHLPKVNVNGTRAWLIFPGRARHRENAFTAASSRSLKPVLRKTVTCVTVPVSGRNTMSQIPPPVICLWRASTGYVGRACSAYTTAARTGLSHRPQSRICRGNQNRGQPRICRQHRQQPPPGKHRPKTKTVFVFQLGPWFLS
jgi:hypothetical protein